MKVDIPSLIIGICALATFIVPIAWYHISEKMKEKKLETELTQFAKEQDVALNGHEIWGDAYAIGLDQEHKKLIYVKSDKGIDMKQAVDLSEIKNCRISNGTKSTKNSSGHIGATNYIKLVLHNRDQGKGATSLEIYDGENGRTLTYELSIANKWARKINSSVKKESETPYKIPLL